MNFYKRYMGDYSRDTSHLSLTEHGAYTVLLDVAYGTAKPLPADMESLYRICRASSPSEKRAVETVANQFFPINGDGLRHNERADREIQSHQEQAEINRSIANERYRNRSTNRNTNRATVGSTEGSPNHSQNQRKTKTKAFSVPDWVPKDAWSSYVEMRNQIKKPMTQRAAELAVQKLDELRAAGMPAKAVLEQSVFNSWQGLFPLKNNAVGAEKKVAL